MKKVCFFTILGLLPLISLAQKGSIKVGLKFAPAVNIATVKDKDGTPSSIRYQADGFTQKQENASGGIIGITLEYGLSDHLGLHTGLWFAMKNYHISNQDGNYYGTSRYNTTYLQIPLVFKYTSNEVIDKLKIYVALGPVIELKMSEKLKGGDGAHYWNMSRNYTWLDGTRGRNADGKEVKLFNPLDISIYFAGGATYEVIDNLDLYLGLVMNKGLLNQVNPKLRFDDAAQTKVNTDISIRSFLVGVEFGLAYKLK
jgi:hypothetical protein